MHGVTFKVTKPDINSGRVNSYVLNVIVGTADNADPDVFPYGKSILCLKGDGKLDKLGDLGTIPISVERMLDQDVNPLIAVFRIPSMLGHYHTAYKEYLIPKARTITRVINHNATEDIDHVDITGRLIDILKVYDQDQTYTTPDDYSLIENNQIVWNKQKCLFRLKHNNPNYIQIDNLKGYIESSKAVSFTALPKVLTNIIDSKRESVQNFSGEHIHEILSIQKLSDKTVIDSSLYSLESDGIHILEPDRFSKLGEVLEITAYISKRPKTKFMIDAVVLDLQEESVNLVKSGTNHDYIDSNGEIKQVLSITDGASEYTDFELKDNYITWKHNQTPLTIEVTDDDNISIQLENNESIDSITNTSAGIKYHDNDWDIKDNQIVWNEKAIKPNEGNTLSCLISKVSGPIEGTNLHVRYLVDTTTLSLIDNVLDPKIGIGNLVNIRQDVAIDFLFPIFIAPGLSNYLEVGKQLESIAHQVNGFAVIDPFLTEDYQSVIEMSKLYFSNKTIMLYPWEEIYNPIIADRDYFPYSASMCGMYAREMLNAFNVSPSNKQILKVLGTNTVVPHHNHKNDLVQILNGHNICCLVMSPNKHAVNYGDQVSAGAFISYGNRATDGTFIEVTATLIYIRQAIIDSILQVVDNLGKPMFFTLLNELLGQAAALAKSKDIIYYPPGVKPFEISPEDNTPDSIRNGIVNVRFKFSPYYPMEQINILAEIHSEFLQDIFT